MRAGWEVKKLGDVCGFDKFQAIHKNLPYVGLENIESNTASFLGYLDLKSVKSATFRFTCNHILYGRLRPYLNKVLAPEFEGHCSTEIFPIKPNTSLLREYLLYWFLREQTVEQINATCTGARMPRADMSAVLNFDFLLPPFAEQHRIVAILDQAFEGIAKARANAEQNLQNARAFFESHLQSIFANGGMSWEVKTLNQIAENLDKKRVPITKNVRSNGAYPYYGASGIVDYVGEFIFEGDLLLVSEDGANLLARTYPIAFSIHGKTWINNHAHVLRFKEITTQKLVEFYLNSIPLNDFVSGMAQPKLNQKMLNTIPIPFPPLAEQEVIVAKFDELSAETRRLEALYQRKITLLDELKKSLLQQAFAGEL